MIGTIITLSETEQKICKYIAKARFSNNRENNVVNLKMGRQDYEFTELEGFGGEMAFCKLFGLFPDFSITIRSSKNGSDKGDAILKGKTIDVKTTKYPSGKLIASFWKSNEIKIDFFALMVGKFPSYTFKGFMSKNELIQDERLGSLGYEKTYIAEQNELKEKI